MARADLLLELVRAGVRGDQPLFRKAVEALIAEEREKQHHVLADRLAAQMGPQPNSTQHRLLGPRASAQPTELFVEVAPKRGLDDLFLPPTVAAGCAELVEEHHRIDLLRAYNLEPRHRVLLAGPPGNGKTSLAEALAFELSCSLFVVRYESIIGSYLGETAVRLSKLFEQARTRRCVLFFDEFDVVGKERGDEHETGEIKRVVSSLLLQIDALPGHCVVVAATNHPELLDRAAWRRFQLRLHLPPPGLEEIQAWLCQFQERAGLSFELSAGELARRLGGVSFAELEQFALDVLRRRVLLIPHDDVRAIVEDRLRQWEARFQPQRHR